MTIPKKWYELDGQLSDTLSVKQFSTNFDIYYDMVNQIIGSGGNFIKKCKNGPNLAFKSGLSLHNHFIYN